MGLPFMLYRKKEEIILQTSAVALAGVSVKFWSRRTNHISRDLQESISTKFYEQRFAELFCTYSLGLYFFGKRKLAKSC